MSRTAHTVLLVSFAAGCLSIGCAGGAPKKLYEGAIRPLEEVARLDVVSVSMARIHGVDGKRVRARSLLLEPGVHEIIVFVRVQHRVDLLEWTITQYCHIPFRFEAGKRYELFGIYEKNRGDTGGDEIQVGAKIVDPTTGRTQIATSCGGRPELEY